MNVLLDTHAWLWMMLEPDRIGAATRALVARPSTTFHLSIASAWEIAIKHAAGRLTLPEPPLAYVASRTSADGVVLVAIELEHVCRSAELARIHGDPFDRLLVAQAEHARLTLMTADSELGKYGVTVLDPRR